MNDKLTAQEAALYLGQEMQLRWKNRGRDNEPWFDNKVTWQSLSLIEEKEMHEGRLLLRPLSDLTQEEEYECQRIQLNMQDEMKYLGCEVSARVGNYLRSLGIDIDRLIEAGKALDKTKATVNN